MSAQGIDRTTSCAEDASTALPERSAKRTKDLYVHAALGYAMLALSEARNGRHPDAMAALEAADELLIEFSPDDAQLALRVQLAIARTAMIVGDTAMARRALGQSQQLRTLNAGDRSPGVGHAGMRRPAAVAALGAGLLTPAEMRLLSMLPSHLSFAELAGKFHLSRNTIKSQTSSVYRKLGVESRSQAVLASRQLGFVEA